MLFVNPAKKIKPGDFVIGARRYASDRIFSEPCLVLEVKDSRALVMIEDNSVWYGIEQLELVVLNEQPENG